MRSWARTAARLIALAGVLVAVAAVRVVTASHAELVRGGRALDRGDRGAAIVSYRRAARWYAPGNPYATEALDHLVDVARAAERDEDRETALVAWRSARNAILASRSVAQPYPERLARAEAEIVRLTVASANEAGREEARERAEAAFERPLEPSMGWTLVLLLGWLTWTIAAFAFAQLAIDEEDRIRAAPARVLGTLVVVGFGLFVIGMALA